jgi:hypothetical protein
MRLQPQGAPASSAWPSAASIASTAFSTREGDRPAAPKNPIAPARAAAITISAVAMPFAISPTT